jgi:Flagellar protein FlbT
MPLKLSLKPQEKFVLNGAVLTNGDKRTSLSFKTRPVSSGKRTSCNPKTRPRRPAESTSRS